MSVKYSFNYGKTKIDIICTSKDDIMYNHFNRTNKFYEISYLKYILNHKDRLFKSKVFTVIDVGANIGNHTIFFTKIMNAQVFAFEPLTEAFLVLQENIKLNNIESQVVARQIGISANSKNISIIKSPKNMCGSTEWWYNSTGQVKSLPLDYLFQDKIDLLKIDVQGMEIEVLKGAKHLIQIFKPIIMIEITKISGKMVNKNDFDKWLIENEYDYFDKEKTTFKSNTYLIGPKSVVLD